jgi:hypothetical protein
MSGLTLMTGTVMLAFFEALLARGAKLGEVDNESLDIANVARIHMYLDATSCGIRAAGCQKSGQPGN